MNNIDKKKYDYPIEFRPSKLARSIQFIIFIIGIFLTLITLITGVYLMQFHMFFVVISLVISIFIIWFLCRQSYEIVFKHKISISNKGIYWRYLGVMGFTDWDNLSTFDIDTARGWHNITFSTSDKRHMRVSTLGFRKDYPIQNDDVWGIRLNIITDMSKTWLSHLPIAESIDFIPITLITKIPLNRDKYLDLDKFKEKEFGQILYEHAPHLFDEYDEWKPKNQLRDNYSESHGWYENEQRASNEQHR